MHVLCTLSTLCSRRQLAWTYSPNRRDKLKNIPIQSGPIDRHHSAAVYAEGNNWTNNGVYKKHMFNQSHTYCCAESHCNPLYKNSSNATGPENKSLKRLIFVSRSQCRSRKPLITSRMALIRTRYIPDTIRDDALTPTLNFWISLIVTPGPLPE